MATNLDEEEKKGRAMDLLQPEILSNQEIIAIFKERKIEIPHIETLDHDTLVDLFYKNVIPMPQRTYRQNRRGLAATKQQVIMSKLKRSHEQMNNLSYTTQSSSKNSQDSNSRFICSFNLPSTSGDRLKPPPSAINPNRKVIVFNKSKPSTLSSPAKTSTTLISKPLPKEVKPNGTPIMSLVPQKTEIKDDALVTIKTTPDESVTVTKIVPTKATKRSKIKLNRTSLTLSSPVTTPTTPPEFNSQMEVTKEMDDRNKEPMSQMPEDSEDEGVVRKKFKSVSIKWP